MVIALLVTWLLMVGTRESAVFNAILVAIKVTALTVFTWAPRARAAKSVACRRRAASVGRSTKPSSPRACLPATAAWAPRKRPAVCSHSASAPSGAPAITTRSSVGLDVSGSFVRAASSSIVAAVT